MSSTTPAPDDRPTAARPQRPPAGQRHRQRVVVALIALTVGTGALAVGAELRSGRGAADAAGPSEVGTTAAPLPRLTVTGERGDGRVLFQRPLAVTVTGGTITGVTGTHPDGTRVSGSVQGDGSYRSAGPLRPAASYVLTVTVADVLGASHPLPLVVRTTAATRTLGARLSPRDGAKVGVGMPVVLELTGPVREPAQRAAVERRLTVRSTPAVTGSWRWLSDTTLHYRPAQFWPAGLKVDVTADLQGLALADGTASDTLRTTVFRVGEQLISTVDIKAKTMTVRRGGSVLRVMPASMGQPRFPTRGGTHIVLEKAATKVMDSATVGLPEGTDDYYRTEVEWAVRLSYSGEFTHSAPWSVKDQGIRNVSHGCVNLSPANARWFFDLARRGDVVQVKNASVGPLPDDPGTVDWNMPFSRWRSGSALS